MTIVNKSPNKILFETVSCGEVFKDKYCNVCMKIETTDCGINTVRLSDGSADYTSNDDEVERIKCQLVIEQCIKEPRQKVTLALIFIPILLYYIL